VDGATLFGAGGLANNEDYIDGLYETRAVGNSLAHSHLFYHQLVIFLEN